MTEHAAAVEAAALRVLEAVADAAERTGVSWMITGAMARRLVFEGIHGEAPGRLTRDWDLAVQVADWARMHALEACLIEAAGFEPDSRQRQRMRAPGDVIVDLVPFGGVEGQRARIQWDGDGEVELNVAGFREALEHAYNVQLNGRVTVRVASPPGLAVLKLIAWRERHLEHDRDAEDLAFLLRHFQWLIADEVHERYPGIMAEVDYDLSRAGARVLGYEAGRLAGPDLQELLARWLVEELGRETESALVVSTSRYLASRSEHEALEMLQSFRDGWCN